MRLLLAGNYKEAVQAVVDLKAKGENVDDIQVLSDPHAARAVERGTEIILTGRYIEREDWPDFHDLIRARFLKETWL